MFVLGTGYLVLSRLPVEERKRWLAVITPSVLAIVFGSLVAPQWSGLFVGAGLGWIVAGILVFRNMRGPQNYKAAVKAMRKRDYVTAIAAMTAQIEDQPKQAEHYRFRAELYRLSGNLKAARKDYHRMSEIDSGSAVAYNGLAEVELQARRYEEARKAAQTAQELAPDEWVAAYNLGMIEDRLEHSETAILHLKAAIALGMPDSRHRLLAQLYLYRAHNRLHNDKAAAEAYAALKREKAGLEEWDLIMSADEAAALRDVLSEDINEARCLLSDEAVAVRS